MARPLRLKIPFYNNMQVQYVAPWGDPGNDGFDFRYPKLTWYQAYEALPSSGGEIYIHDLSYIGKPTATSHITPLAKQGIRLSNAVDGSGNYWPGFAPMKPVRTIGVGGDYVPFAEATMAGLYPGDPGDGSFPQSADYDFGVWVAGNNFPFSFRNITVIGTHGGYRLGVSGDPGINPYTDSQRTAQTIQFYFENCGDFHDGSGGQQPGWDFGYAYFGRLRQISSNRGVVAAIDQDKRAAVLVKASSTGGSTALDIDGLNTGQGGIIYYPGSTTWSFTIRNVLIEGDFSNPLPPAVWAKNLNNAGVGLIGGQIVQADQGAGSAKSIKIDAGSGFTASQVAIEGIDPFFIDQGSPCTLRGGTSSVDFSNLVWPHRDGQNGFIRDKIWGKSDGWAYNVCIGANRWRNLHPQHSGGDGESGTVNAVPQTPSSNAVYTASNATGGHGVATPVADRWGGTTAFKLGTNNSSLATCDLFNANRNVVPGDSFLLSFWAKIANPGASGGAAPMNMTATGANVSGSKVYNLINGEPVGYFRGEDGLWQYYTGLINITSTVGGGSVACTLHVQLQAAQNHDVTYCGVKLQQIPVADGLMEGTAQMVLAGPTWQAAAGSISVPPNALLVAGSLGVDNAVSATTPGSVVKKIQVFDREGNSLGFVPVYSTIT